MRMNPAWEQLVHYKLSELRQSLILKQKHVIENFYTLRNCLHTFK